MVKKGLLSLLALLVLVSNGSGEYEYAIEKYDVSVNLTGEIIHEKIVITLSGANPPSDYVYAFSYPILNAIVYDDNGALAHFFEGDTIIITLDARPDVSYTFTLEFDTEGYVQKVSENRWVFSPTFSFDVPVQTFSITVSVPSHTAFEAPIHPNPTSFFSTKDSLSLRWVKENLEPEEEIFIIVNFKGVLPNDNDNTILWVAGGFFLSLLSFVAGLLFSRRRTRVKEVYFVGDEKVILDAIKEEGGKVIQSTLTKKTNFSKAKISKILAELEQRGIVQKDKYKRTNVIILKEMG